ncbi:MmcQ/YjbR family DNA-binding protein [Aestuariibacter sp. AA17]|uniref:MmcQ/YjbR family DNA-binding protein n=1 Tax=Fluctibacter corallii TaxID=2984329 RepID=A0ABT3AC24_9ALTE|nr:MmcQ/YjbR family DNA-binding protein [Aestuariibacter sp. AA17]MCV2886229.1 MmcQ/YjbR family DNA-binding protein [Aestuariibacter sp. AA17]
MENNIEQYLLSLPEAWLDYPFGDDVKVFKVKQKMFALVGEREGKKGINLKCDPLEAESLRDIFPAITAAYHMNKRHWITVQLDGSVPEGEVKRLVDNSFMLVVNGLPKRERASLALHF